MFNRICYTTFFTQISFFVFISLIWSNASGECRCHLLSCHCKNVEFIPKLPSNVTSVILEDSICSLQKSFIANLSSLKLEELSLKKTRIRHIEQNVFENLPFLKRLSFLDPYTNLKPFILAFKGLYLTNITKLTINDLDISSDLPLLLSSLNGTDITELSLIRCRLTKIDSQLFFSSLRKLRYLDLNQNYIDHMSWSRADHLQVLLLRHCIITLPTFLESDGTPLFPNLTRLEVSVIRIETMDSSTFKGLAKLETLYLGIESKSTISRTFLFATPRLKRLHIQGLTSTKNRLFFKLIVDYGAFKSNQLQHLQLEYFQVDVPFKESFFRHTPNLLSLQLKSTELLYLYEDLNEELTFLKKLENLTLTYTILRKVPQALCNLPNLTRLDLGNNRITLWNDTNCPVMSRLQYLSLSENEIQLIERNTFSPQLIKNDYLFWDLSLNTFLCNCQLLWFMSWSQQNRDRFKYYPNDYKCATPPKLIGKLLNSSFFSNGQCSTGNSPSIIIASSVIGSFMILLIIIASLMYYKRWNIRYLFYLMQSHRKQKKEEKDTRNYSFDAFVCYHHSDIQWLLNELRPKLETENNFSLCIHDRDFVVGRDIVENIVESIEQSRKVLLLLSNQFVLSQWCRFELAMAHQHVIEREENLLVVVLLEDIDIPNKSRRLALLLRQKTYLEWTEDKDGQTLFWKRLISCLRAPNIPSP